MTVKPRYLTAKALAEYVSVSRNTVDHLVRTGKLPKPVYLTPKMPRWDREAVDAMLGRGAKSGDPVMEAINAAYPPQAKRSQAAA